MKLEEKTKQEPKETADIIEQAARAALGHDLTVSCFFLYVVLVVPTSTLMIHPQPEEREALARAMSQDVDLYNDDGEDDYATVEAY